MAIVPRLASSLAPGPVLQVVAFRFAAGTMPGGMSSGEGTAMSQVLLRKQSRVKIIR